MLLLSRFFGAVLPGQPCNLDGGGFLGFPHWYKYLQGIGAPSGSNATSGSSSYTCVAQVGSLSDVWLIVAAIIEILLRLAALAAIAFIVYGGVQFITSQGDPGNTKQARQTVINALIGLVISIGATSVISFIAGRFN